jgi:NAD(P)-dependent dehydrogenase (short-subunit alcohol dehydrogenase family)
VEVIVEQGLSVDLSQRICLVTGASTGIGKEIARQLAKLGATVVLGCRSAERGEAARAWIAADTGNAHVSVMKVDVASQASIRAFAEEFTREHKALHVLVNNAGMWQPKRGASPDGVELTFATNVLGLHLLTELLLDLLKKSSPARIINVASEVAGDLDLSDIQFERRAYSGMKVYGASKQAVRMLTWEQAERLQGTGVTANAMHPGLVGGTEANRSTGGVLGVIMPLVGKLFGKTPAQGADTATWMAASPELEGVTGKFFVDRKEKACKFRDAASQKRLWALCEEMAQRSAQAAPA